MSDKPIRDIADITVEEILAMGPGPELDYLVARYMPPDAQESIIGNGAGGIECFEDWDKSLWNPSQDANDALAVWRALPEYDADGSYRWWEALRGKGGSTIIRLRDPFGQKVGIGMPGDFCLAVCRAYLWAMKHWGVAKETEG